MVEEKYQREKEKAKAAVQNVAAVSLTADMWTSINMDAYLAVTCHYLDRNTCLHSALLGAVKFPQAHTAENLAGVMTSLMEEWGITSKITCLVTDGAPNMIACGRDLRLRHAICIAHILNLTVKKALDLTPVLSSIRAKARKLVGYFRSSTTAKVSSLMLFSHLLMYYLFYISACHNNMIYLFVFKGETCSCSGADGETQTKTASGGRNQVEQHISHAPATGGAQGACGGSFGKFRNRHPWGNI